MKAAKNTICICFDKDAEAAARLYAATFPDSEITGVHRAPSDFPGGKQTDRYWDAIVKYGGQESGCGRFKPHDLRSQRHTSMYRVLFAVFSWLAATCALSAVDVSALWDTSDPALSERRFREALSTAVGDDRLILQTQIARTHAMRKDFSAARDMLQAMSSDVADAGAEARARYWLELGRTYASHRHDPAGQTPESLALARSAYSTALTIAKAAKLDDLAVDALHMFVFVDTSPEDQLRWNREALAVIAGSEQPAAKRWEASISSNTGEALYDLGRFDEALELFRRALLLREQSADARGARDARWHIARILRVKRQVDDALEMQLSLEREADGAREPRYYIYEELQLLYEAKGDSDRARQYARRAKALRQPDR